MRHFNFGNSGWPALLSAGGRMDDGDLDIDTVRKADKSTTSSSITLHKHAMRWFLLLLHHPRVYHAGSAEVTRANRRYTRTVFVLSNVVVCTTSTPYFPRLAPTFSMRYSTSSTRTCTCSRSRNCNHLLAPVRHPALPAHPAGPTPRYHLYLWYQVRTAFITIHHQPLVYPYLLQSQREV